MKIQTVLCSGRAQHRKDSGFLSSPYPGATQLSLDLYVSGTLPAVVLLLEPRANAWKRKSLCVGPLGGTLGFSGAFHHTWMDRILTEVVGPALPSTDAPSWGGWCGPGGLCCSEGTSAAEISLSILGRHM